MLTRISTVYMLVNNSKVRDFPTYQFLISPHLSLSLRTHTGSRPYTKTYIPANVSTYSKFKMWKNKHLHRKTNSFYILNQFQYTYTTIIWLSPSQAHTSRTICMQSNTYCSGFLNVIYISQVHMQIHCGPSEFFLKVSLLHKISKLNKFGRHLFDFSNIMQKMSLENLASNYYLEFNLWFLDIWVSIQWRCREECSSRIIDVKWMNRKENIKGDCP